MRRHRKPVAVEPATITHADGTKTPVIVALVAHRIGGYQVVGYDEPLRLNPGDTIAVHFTPPPRKVPTMSDTEPTEAPDEVEAPAPDVEVTDPDDGDDLFEDNEVE